MLIIKVFFLFCFVLFTAYLELWPSASVKKKKDDIVPEL